MMKTKCNITYLFSEIPPAYKKIWILGDQFVTNSLEDYFQKRRISEYNGFMKEHFDVTGFCSSKYTSSDTNAVSRMRNILTTVMQKQPLLPKYVVIVIDDDLIKYLDHEGYGATKAYGRIINNIMIEHGRVLQAHRVPSCEVQKSRLSKNYLDRSTES